MLYTLIIEEGLKVADSCKFIGLKDSFYKVRKVFFILFLRIIIYKLKMSIFKDFKFNIVINVSYRLKVDSLTPLLLTFVNLLAYIYYII